MVGSKSYLAKLDLTGQSALITGASQGIGTAISRGLAEAGAHVILSARNESALNALRDEVIAAGGSAEVAPLDVTDTDAVEAMAARFPDLDILVANSGIARSGVAAETADDVLIDEVFDVNFRGVVRCGRAFGRNMLARKKGNIVVTGSISAMMSNTPQDQSYYNASKAAVHHWCKSVAAEWANRGVRVNVIAPGYVVTPMTSYGIEADPVMAARWQELTPADRFGQPEEIATIALFLASEASSAMTGAVVVADGGYTLW